MSVRPCVCLQKKLLKKEMLCFQLLLAMWHINNYLLITITTKYQKDKNKVFCFVKKKSKIFFKQLFLHNFNIYFFLLSILLL